MIVDKKKVFHILTYVLLIGAILAVVLPVIIGGGYTYLCEDDFSFESGARTFARLHGDFLGALVGTYKYYMSWQGTYLPNFLWFFLRPYDRWGMIGFHAVVVSIILLFVFSVFLLVKTFVKERWSGLLILLITYIVAFNSSSPGLEKEFLYWYTGSLNYALVFALSCITLALALRLKREEDKKKIHYLAIIGAITGFLASGGTLEVTSFNCSWLLLVLVLCYKEIAGKKVIVVPFVASFIGALINALAKGNFVRSGSTMGELDYGILDALRDTMVCWKREWNIIFENKFFIVSLLILFVICLMCKVQIFEKGVSTGQFLLSIPASFAIEYFTAFPVVLGYHGSELIFRRTVYTYELLTKFMIMFLIIVFAQWFREHIKLNVFIPSGIVLAFSLIVIMNNNVMGDISKGFSYNAAKELNDGTIQELYEFRKDVLLCLEQCEKGTDVYLELPGVPSSEVMYGMGITSVAGDTCNMAAAGYFGLKSLAIEYADGNEFPDFFEK